MDEGNEMENCLEQGSKKWSDLETKRLISLYEESELLWNVTLKEYRNRVKKQEALRDISKRLKIDQTEVQRKLHNLRSQYNSELKKIRKKMSGQSTDEVYVSNWPYFAALKFIQVNLPTTSSTLTIKSKQSNDVMQGNGSEEEYVDDSGTSTIQRQEDTEEEMQAPAIKRKKLKPSQEMPLYVQQAMRQLNQANDEEQVFGDFCASELRQIKNPANKRAFKQIVMEAITNIGEAEALGVVYKHNRPLNFTYSQPTAAQASPSPHISEGSSSSSYSEQHQYEVQRSIQQMGQQEHPEHESSLLQLSGYNATS